MPRLEPGELVTSSTRFAAFETMQGPQLEDQLFNYVSHLFAHCLDLVVACKWNTHHHRPACEFFSHSKPCRVHSWRTNYSMRAKVHTHGLRLVRNLTDKFLIEIMNSACNCVGVLRAKPNSSELAETALGKRRRPKLR